jgi:hypothetical protein
MYEGFFKVNQEGGSYVVATLYNPNTGEEKTLCVRDYDYADCSIDNDEIYDMPIDENARREWMHKHGNILIGDTVRVFKGRKVKVGTVAKVVDIRPYRNGYGQTVCMYAYLDTGERTNIDNCEIA